MDEFGGMGGAAPPEEDFTRIPVEERLAHKVSERARGGEDVHVHAIRLQPGASSEKGRMAG